MEDKICPLLSIGKDDYEYCNEWKCAWWIEGRTTEEVPIKCCALEFIAMKSTSDGMYQV